MEIQANTPLNDKGADPEVQPPCWTEERAGGWGKTPNSKHEIPNKSKTENPKSKIFRP
jgi:hypothetical protein